MSCHLLQVAVFLLILVQVNLAIKCWECNSRFKSECDTVPSGPQNKDTLDDKIRSFYVDCELKNSSLNYKLCR